MASKANCLVAVDNLAKTPLSQIFRTVSLLWKIWGFIKKISRPLPDNKPFIEKKLSKCPNVWVRNNAPSGPLAPLYNGPYKVLNRYKKYFTILCNRVGPVNVTIDRLKACVTLPTLTEINDSDNANSDQSSDSNSSSVIHTDYDQIDSEWESEID